MTTTAVPLGQNSHHFRGLADEKSVKDYSQDEKETLCQNFQRYGEGVNSDPQTVTNFCKPSALFGAFLSMGLGGLVGDDANPQAFCEETLSECQAEGIDFSALGDCEVSSEVSSEDTEGLDTCDATACMYRRSLSTTVLGGCPAASLRHLR